jgi:predicted glycosyltransferase involved in capsule biosynthesis
MNRSEHLAKTLPTWLALREVDEIVIVDWSSRIPIKINDPRVTVIRVEGQKYFERSAAWNLGLDNSNTDFIFLCDVDVLVLRSPFELVKKDASRFFYVSFGIREGTFGSCIITKEQAKIKFDESIKYYGVEDSNFYLRLQGAGFRKLHCLSTDYLEHIHHSDELRYREQPEKHVYQYYKTDTICVRSESESARLGVLRQRAGHK